MKEFILKEEHLLLLSKTYIGWDSCCFGAPCVDCKRPYGNSDVFEDIWLILYPDKRLPKDYTEAEEEEMLKLHTETRIALQIVLLTRSFVPGKYVRDTDYMDRDWKLEKS